MYFLTLKDPNYMVKGSRDPLGFQVLWQQAGHTIIPSLSTVSNNIRDFQVMALARYCQDYFDVAERDRLAFFLCFEQLMAYVRFVESKGYDSFNGIDKVRRIMNNDDKQLSLSVSGSDQLLSNQKSYGIWGKYNRPFEEIGLGYDERLLRVQKRKLAENDSLAQVIEKLVAKKGTPYKFNRDLLSQLVSVLKQPDGEEKACFTDYLLIDHYDGALLKLVHNMPELTEKSFYEQLDIMEAATTDVRFATQLKRLRATEQVLCPLNRVFRYLQEQSFWPFADIEKDSLIVSWTKTAVIDTATLIDPRYTAILQSDNIELVTGLAAINAEVCARRGSDSWLTVTADGVEVNHFEGGFNDPGYNPLTDNDYTYFLGTWFHLYKQLN